jgi:hypothetical protein
MFHLHVLLLFICHVFICSVFVQSCISGCTASSAALVLQTWHILAPCQQRSLLPVPPCQALYCINA